MVSNARLDLPEPESPVTTIRLSRGISSEMFLRLCTRAPCTAIVVRGAVFTAPLFPFRLTLREEAIEKLAAVRLFAGVEERQFLHLDAALLREVDRRGGLADQPLVRQVLARGGHAADIEVPLEMVLDLAARPRFAGFAQMIDHRPEQ